MFFILGKMTFYFTYTRLKKLDWKIFGFLFYIFWKHCVVIETRGHFGRHLFKLARKKPIAVLPFLLNCAFFDDLDEYRQLVRKKLQPYTRII
jgi:hypothetical protein